MFQWSEGVGLGEIRNQKCVIIVWVFVAIDTRVILLLSAVITMLVSASLPMVPLDKQTLTYKHGGAQF